ncbi:predicted protein [Postia placenta Mad-698-R]|nr:predicted protein [Postia placenta Mad-698-R]
MLDEAEHELCELAQDVDLNELQTRLSLEGTTDDTLDSNNANGCVDEVVKLTALEHTELEEDVRPVRLILIKIRKLAFTIVNSSTLPLPTWKLMLEELNLPLQLMSWNVAMHWNSTFNMLDFVSQYRIVIDAMTGNRKHELYEWEIAGQLRNILKSNTSEVYQIAMVLHPCHKLSYFWSMGWEDDWIATAKSIVQDEFCHLYAALVTNVMSLSMSL